MADQIYVELVDASSKDIFDTKFKAVALKALDKALAAAIRKSSKLTLDKPKEKGAKGWKLDSSVETLEPDKSGENLVAKLSMAISTWPGKSLKAMPNGKATVSVRKAGSVDASDVEAAVQEAAKSALKSALPFLEGNEP